MGKPTVKNINKTLAHLLMTGRLTYYCTLMMINGVTALWVKREITVNDVLSASTPHAILRILRTCSNFSEDIACTFWWHILSPCKYPKQESLFMKAFTCVLRTLDFDCFRITNSSERVRQSESFHFEHWLRPNDQTDRQTSVAGLDHAYTDFLPNKHLPQRSDVWGHQIKGLLECLLKCRVFKTVQQTVFCPCVHVIQSIWGNNVITSIHAFPLLLYVMSMRLKQLWQTIG